MPSEATIRVVIVLSIIFRWSDEIVDVKRYSCLGTLWTKTHLQKGVRRALVALTWTALRHAVTSVEYNLWVETSS